MRPDEDFSGETTPRFSFPDFSRFHAILDDDHNVIPVRDIYEWGPWFEQTENRRVAETSLNGWWVSTVFLGLDHGFGGVPRWFETMVFPEGEEPIVPELGGRLREHLSNMQLRYTTWAEAEEGHRTVGRLSGGGFFKIILVGLRNGVGMTNSHKATHSGTCQSCGRQQKLPNGKLSKHGYTVEWGFFSGVCRGAHALPFELSCDLCKEDIAWAQHEVVRLQGKYDEVLSYTGPIATVSVYDRKACKYRWIQAEVKIRETYTREEDGSFWFQTYYYACEEAKMGTIEEYSDHSPSIEAAAAKLNQRYADAVIGEQITQLGEYIRWQQKRVAKWEPKPLSPIKASRLGDS
jgi:hypothetical protein